MGQAEPCTDQRDRHRHHPDNRQAEHRIQHDLPGQALHRGCDGDSAERQPDQQGHQGARFLNEWHQRLAPAATCRAEREPADERGDEPVAVQRHPGRISAHRQAQHRRAGKALSGPAAPPRHAYQQPTDAAHGHADEKTQNQLRSGCGRAVASDLASRCRSRDGDRHKRCGDPVVEAAFDIDQPANPGRYRLVSHHARAKCGVSWRQRRAHQQRQPDTAAAGQGKRQQCSQADRQRKRDPQQPQVHARLRPQLVQPDPRRVREQNQGESELRQFLDQLVIGCDAQERQRSMSEQQPGDDEHDRSGDIEPFQPGRQRPPPKYQRRHNGQVRNAHDVTCRPALTSDLR